MDILSFVGVFPIFNIIIKRKVIDNRWKTTGPTHTDVNPPTRIFNAHQDIRPVPTCALQRAPEKRINFFTAFLAFLVFVNATVQSTEGLKKS